jgi:hypothetical protein
MSAAEAFEYAKIAFAAGLFAGICYVGHQIYRLEIVPPSIESAGNDATERARQRERGAALAALQPDAAPSKAQELLDRAQRDAANQAAMERRAAEWKKKAAEVAHRREVAFAEFQVDRALRAAQDREARMRLRRIEQYGTDQIRAEAAFFDALLENSRLDMQFIRADDLEKELAQTEAAHAELERKKAGLATRYQTHLDTMDRVLKKNGGASPHLGSTRVVGNVKIEQPDADGLADWATLNASEREANLDLEDLQRVKAELAKNESLGAELEAKLAAFKRSAPEDFGDAPTAPQPFAARPAANLKTLYMKDGRSILVQNLIYVGDEIEFKGKDGFPGHVKKADVSRVGRDEE